jgi:hypothetical protein
MEKVKFTSARALIALRKHKVKMSSLERWEAEGFMPAKYAGVETNGFRIGDKSLFDLRTERYPTQEAFLTEFNRKYDLEVSQVHLSNWERGKNKPSKVYRGYLEKFFA